MAAQKTALPSMEAVATNSVSYQDASPRRAVATIGLLGVALIHLIDLPGKMEETPYLGVAFIGVVIASLLLAGGLVVRPDRTVWLAAGALAAAVFVGYVISRTTGLPAATEDIGNWREPLGLASLFVEGTVVLLALPAVRRAGRAFA